MLRESIDLALDAVPRGVNPETVETYFLSLHNRLEEHATLQIERGHGPTPCGLASAEVCLIDLTLTKRHACAVIGSSSISW